MMAPLHLKLRLNAFKIFLRSKSSARPVTDVMLLRPLRIWMRMCTGASRSAPSSKASAPGRPHDRGRA